MTSHMPGTADLDEFFDFDQLDRDHGAKPANYAKDGMAMEWTVNEPLPVPTLDPVLPDELHTPSVFHQEFFLGQPHWPLADSSDQLSPGQETYISSIPNLVVTPSSSRVAFTQQDLVKDVNEHIPIYGLARKSLPSGMEGSPSEFITLTSTGNVIAHHRAQSPEPLRQASSASWKPASAKRKGPQSRIPLESRQILEDEFATNAYPCSWEMDIIAHQANLDVKKVRNWFNNTRARKKNGG
jgi:hypothetical protein